MENYNDAPATSIVLSLAHLAAGKIVAYRECPLGTPSTDPLCKAVNGTAAALGRLDAQIGELNDPNAAQLDVIALRAAVAAPFTQLQIRMASVAAAIAKARDQLAADADAFYSPPAISDTAATILDVERRSMFNTASESERGAWWQAMSDGGLAPLLSALARAEFGGSADRAKTLFKALAAQRDPARVAAFGVELERLGWATSTLDQIVAVIDQSAMQLGPADAVAVDERRAA